MLQVASATMNTSWSNLLSRMANTWAPNYLLVASFVHKRDTDKDSTFTQPSVSTSLQYCLSRDTLGSQHAALHQSNGTQYSTISYAPSWGMQLPKSTLTHGTYRLPIKPIHNWSILWPNTRQILLQVCYTTVSIQCSSLGHLGHCNNPKTSTHSPSNSCDFPSKEFSTSTLIFWALISPSHAYPKVLRPAAYHMNLQGFAAYTKQRCLSLKCAPNKPVSSSFYSTYM